MFDKQQIILESNISITMLEINEYEYCFKDDERWYV
jgi:hypothetical protein